MKFEDVKGIYFIKRKMFLNVVCFAKLHLIKIRRRINECI